MTPWMPAPLLELIASDEATVECECRSCDVRWIGHLGRTVCWCCGGRSPMVRLMRAPTAAAGAG